MSIANKLNYLLETKNAIKNALIALGVEVSDSDTFRSYAEKIASIQVKEPVFIPLYYKLLNQETGQELAENQSIKSSTILVDAGTTVEKLEKDGVEIELPEPITLTGEGIYKITLVNSDNEKTIRTFRIDNTAPIVTGLNKLAYKQTVIFENIEDVASAVLTNPDGTTTDLYQLYKDGQLVQEGTTYKYEITVVGSYSIVVLDEAGNDYIYSFRLREWGKKMKNITIEQVVAILATIAGLITSITVICAFCKKIINKRFWTDL